MPRHGRWVFSGIGIALLSTSIHATLPDLIIDRAAMANGLHVRQETLTASDCAVLEGCAGASGQRTLIRFTAAIANIGKGDLVLGKPNDNPDLYHFSECHGHFHLQSMVRYDLIDSSGNVVVSSGKRAFCMRDNVKYLGSAGPSNGYDCDNQGITAGWQDIYPKDLDCQFLDVTGVPGGRYTLRATVNPDGVIEESNRGNNSASISVQINGGGNGKHAKKPKKNKGKHKGWYKNGKANDGDGDNHDGKKDDDDGHDGDKDDDDGKSWKDDNGKHKGWDKHHGKGKGKGKAKGKGKHKGKKGGHHGGDKDSDDDKDDDGDVKKDD